MSCSVSNLVITGCNGLLVKGEAGHGPWMTMGEGAFAFLAWPDSESDLVSDPGFDVPFSVQISSSDVDP